jgi:hypothetical protein
MPDYKAGEVFNFVPERFQGGEPTKFTHHELGQVEIEVNGKTFLVHQNALLAYVADWVRAQRIEWVEQMPVQTVLLGGRSR